MGGVLRIVLRELSVFEAKHTVTDRLAAATRKMWIIQFVNTALILLVINFKLPDKSRIRAILNLKDETSLILQGEFDDFFPEWYGLVGSAITLACFVNAIMPLANFGFWLIAGCKRCCDRSCSFDSSRTK